MEDSNLTTPAQPQPPVTTETENNNTQLSQPPAQEQVSSSAITGEKSGGGTSKSLLIMLVVMIIIVVIGGIYLYLKMQAENKQKAAANTNNAQAVEQINSLKNDLGGISEEATTSSEDINQLDKDLSTL